MSKRNTIGDLFRENILRDQAVVNSSTAFHTITPSLDWMDGVSVQLITEDRPARAILHDAADHVVASSGTWTFTNGAFASGDIGASMVIANASNGGNNGTKTILTVVNATTVTTATTSLVNETFGVTVTATVTDLTMAGAWSVDASNDYVQGTLPGLNQVQPNAGHWSPIANDQFSPAIAAVTTASSQYVQLSPFTGRWLRFTFTETTGAGLVTITFSAKGNS